MPEIDFRPDHHPRDRLLLQTAGFICALIFCGAIGAATSLAIAPPRQAGSMADGRPARDTLTRDTLTQADRDLIEIATARPLCDAACQEREPKAVFAERWAAAGPLFEGQSRAAQAVKASAEAPQAAAPAIPGTQRASITRDLMVAESEQELVSTPMSPATSPAMSPARRLQAKQSRESRNDGLCARHGMKQVWSGKYRWRCRR